MGASVKKKRSYLNFEDILFYLSLLACSTAIRKSYIIYTERSIKLDDSQPLVTRDIHIKILHV